MGEFAASATGAAGATTTTSGTGSEETVKKSKCWIRSGLGGISGGCKSFYANLTRTPDEQGRVTKTQRLAAYLIATLTLALLSIASMSLVGVTSMVILTAFFVLEMTVSLFSLLLLMTAFSGRDCVFFSGRPAAPEKYSQILKEVSERAVQQMSQGDEEALEMEALGSSTHSGMEGSSSRMCLG
ncbi:hypothetical protein [Chlamydiifrater phoenicopteri]|uniref:hypothetical protein n=1 Tax=Chlamydiifrater phoenicopteri TaxID=2681469 RepID=UPI001BD0C57D|nr:hypothetical protein [Chlamydiifrater phoenicopteri]